MYIDKEAIFLVNCEMLTLRSGGKTKVNEVDKFQRKFLLQYNPAIGDSFIREFGHKRTIWSAPTVLLFLTVPL